MPEVYVYRIARGIGSLTAAVDGLNTLVFRAGVGVNAAPIRARIADPCRWPVVRLDPAANATDAGRISAPVIAVKVPVIPTDEPVVIARGAAPLPGP